MPTPGIANFQDRYFLDYPYLDGTLLPNHIPIEVEDSEGLIVMEAHEGTSVLQRIYRTPTSPKVWDAKRFTFRLLASDEDAWRKFKQVKSRGGWVYFSNGMRCVDTFPAVSGTAYNLTRRLANGLVAEVTANPSEFPTRVYLDGVLTPGAATVVTQTVTAASTGEIMVEYTPAFRVAITSFPESVAAFNVGYGSVVMTEVIRNS